MIKVIDIKPVEFVYIGLYFSLGFNVADQVVYMGFDIMRMYFGYPLGWRLK